MFPEIRDAANRHMTAPPSETRSIVQMLLSVVLFASNALLVRGLALHYPAADGWVASLFRGTIGIAVVLSFFGFGRGLQLSRIFTQPLLAVRGLIGGITILILYITVVQLGAARAIVINLSYPMFGSLCAAIWLKEHLPLRSWLWMAAGFAGLVIFLGADVNGGVGPYDLLALLGAVLAGVVVTLIRQLRDTEHTSSIYAAQCVASAMIAFVPAVGPTIKLPPVAFWGMVLAGLIVAGGQLALTHSFRTLSVARGSAIQMILPIITALGAWLLFGETFTVMGLVGAIVTLFATWRVVAPKASPRLASPAQSA